MINGVSTITDYLGGYQYKNDALEFFPHAEGYVKNTSGMYSYVFNYTDHLGNVRVSYSDLDKDGSIDKTKNEILEESNYYPFGLKHEPNAVINKQPNYKYKYNGKELQDELGLNMYDYGARNYDPALGRWMNIDPKAETSRRWSPYNYCYNNPLRFIDPDGMQADDWRNKNGQLVYDTKANGGKGAYTEHATEKEKQLGTSLQQTKQGKEQFDKLVNSEQKTIVLVNEKDKPVDKTGTPILGKNVPENSKDPNNNNSTITIYSENIKEQVSDIQKGAEGGNQVMMEMSDGKGDLDVSKLTETKLTSAVFGEEIEHGTKENRELQRSGAPLQKIEEKPSKVSSTILRQSLK